MTATRILMHRPQVTRTYFPILAVLITASLASAADLSDLSDDQLIDQYHRTAYRQELQRRKNGYTKAERDAISAKLSDPSSKRQFPLQYTEDELFECALDLRDDTMPAYKAVSELEKRFKDATEERLNAFTERLRTAYKSTPYPKLLPDMSNARECGANRAVYSALDFIAGNVLPEGQAVALFREIYLESGQRGAVGDFLLKLTAENF